MKGKSKDKEKKNILPGAAAAAFVAAIIVYIVLLSVEKRAMSEYEKGTVLLAQSNITEGIVLTEENIGQYFAERQIDKTLIPTAAVTGLEQVQGMLTATNIDNGSVLTLSMLENYNEKLSGMKQPVIAGFRSEDLYQVVSGTLRTGDYIHIYTVDEETGDAILQWENVWVEQVFDSSGNAVTAEDKSTPAARVNILLEEDKIEAFYSGLEKGSLRAVKVAG